MSQPNGRNDTAKPDLPDGWEWKRLGDLGTWLGGGTPSKRNPEFWTNGTIPWVSPKDMKSWRLAGTQQAVTNQAVEGSAAKVFASNSVAFVVRSGILEHTLPVALVPFEATANQDLRVVTPAANVNAEWFMYAAQASSEQMRRRCRKDGTTVASIDVPSLMDWRLPVPPMKTQLEIVERLDSLEAALASADSLLDAALRRSDQLVRSFHRSIGLGLAELPPAWEWRNVGEVAETDLGKMLDAQKNEGTPRPYLRNVNIQWGRLNLDDIKQMRIRDTEIERYGVREGDLLMCEGGEPGRCAIWDRDEEMFFQKALHRIRPKAVVSAEYLQLYFKVAAQGGGLEKSLTGTTIKHLPGAKLKLLPIPLPPRDEQVRIVIRARKLEAAMDELRAVLELARRRKSEVTRAALSRALVGALSLDGVGRDDRVVSPERRT